MKSLKKSFCFLIVFFMLFGLCFSSFGNTVKAIENSKKTAIYIWGVEDIDYSDFDKVVDYLNIGTIYAGGINIFKESDNGSNDYETLFSFAKENNIKTYIVYDEPEIYIDYMEELMDKIDSYNQNSSYKLEGVAVDSEFHSSGEYAHASQLERINMLKNYVSSMKTAYEYGKTKNLKYVACIPVWYDLLDSDSVEELIKDGCDYVQLMNYAKKNAITNIEKEVEFAKKYNKDIESIAELQIPGPHEVTDDITFYHDGLDACTARFGEIDQAYNYEKLTFCYHYLNPVLELAKDIIDYMDEPQEPIDTVEEFVFEDENLYKAVVNEITGKVTFNQNDESKKITISSSEIKKVTSLKLNNIYISNLAGLEKFTSLQELNLRNNKISDISQISTLSNLEVLDISHNEFTDVKNFNKLTNLKELNIYDNAIWDFDGLSGLTKLEKLVAGDNNERYKASSDQMKLSSIHTLTSLKYIDFSRNANSGKIISELVELTHLEYINLQGTGLNNSYIEPALEKFDNLKTVKYLNIYGCYVWTLTPFTSLTNLEEIELGKNLFPNISQMLDSNGNLVWPNLKKLGIYGLSNIPSTQYEYVHNEEAINRTLNYLVDRFKAGTLELDYENLTDTSLLPHTDSNGIKYVTYDDFGARCDGKFDDMIAIRNAHSFANKIGCEVRAAAGKTYHIFNYYQDSVQLQTNVDWQGAKFIVHDEQIEDKPGRSNRLFRVSSNADDVVTIENPNITLNTKTEKLTGIEDTLNSLNAKGYQKYMVKSENENKKQFIRYGANANDGTNQLDVFEIDTTGNLLNEIRWDYETVTKLTIYPISDKTLTIRNGEFTTNVYEDAHESNYSRKIEKAIYLYRGIYLEGASNVKIENVNHYSSEDRLSGSYYGFWDFKLCSDVVMDNCVLYARMFANSGRSTYDLVMDQCVNFNCNKVTCNDLLDANRWGVNGTKHCKDFVFTNCSLNRIDAHEGIHNLTIKDCYLGYHAVMLTGTGTFNMINTTVEADNLVYLREDYGSTWTGDFNIINCTQKYNGIWAYSMISYAIAPEGDGLHDFGYEVHMPNLNVQNLTLDGNKSNRSDVYYVIMNWDQSKNDITPDNYWPAKIYMNGVTFKNCIVDNPQLRVLFRDIPTKDNNYLVTNFTVKDNSGKDFTSEIDNGKKVVSDENLKLEIKENNAQADFVTISKDGNVVVNNRRVIEKFAFDFKENGNYTIKITSSDNKFDKHGEKTYKLQINKETQEPMQEPEKDNFEITNAFDMVKAMKAGYNLGNSLDALNKGKGFYPDSETLWSNPKVTKEQIAKIKELGFTSIRIPVSYYNHLDENGNIDPDWLARVKAVVDYAYEYDFYIIINVHHDAGMDKNLHWIFSDVNTYEDDLAKIKNLWSQIAPYFKDYDNKLLFEFHNEIMNVDSNWDWNTQTDDFKLVHDMDQELINLVRATGGNNSNRFLITSTWGASSDSRQVESLMYKPYEDTIPNHLIMEVHNYYQEVEKVETLFERLKKSSEEYNMPIIIGECGSTANRLENTARVELAEAYSRLGKECGMSVFWWDNGQLDEFALFDRRTLETTHQDIVEAFIKHFKDEVTPEPEPTPEPLPDPIPKQEIVPKENSATNNDNSNNENANNNSNNNNSNNNAQTNNKPSNENTNTNTNTNTSTNTNNTQNSNNTVNDNANIVKSVKSTDNNVDNTKAEGILPKTGDSNNLIIAVIAVVGLMFILLVVKTKSINEE